MKVGEVAKFQNGYAFKSKDFKPDGQYAVIKIKELKDGEVRFFDDTAYVDIEDEKYYEKYIVKEGDILFALTGDPVSKSNPLSWVGRVAIYNHKKEALLNQRVCKLVPSGGVNPKYIYYFFRQFENFYELASLATGSASQANISTKDIERIEFVLPSMEIQNKVVGYLDALSQKIEINERINNNLEQQAQAIFKSWFVEFDPFGKKQPSEWQTSTLGKVSIMGAGGDKPKVVSPIKTEVCSYPIYSNGLSDEGLYGYTDEPKILDESVTVSARGTIGFVCLRHIPYVPIVRLVTLIPNKDIISAKYLYLWLKQLHITGTGTTQQQLTVPDFQKTEILVPSAEVVSLFTATIDPIFEKIWANQLENDRLAQIRDTLSPKLMSGELDVSSIDL